MENQIVERSKFMIELLGEIDGFDENMFPIHRAMDSGDKRLGELGPWLRKVYALMRYYDREVKLLMVDREYSKPEQCQADCRLCEMKYKHQMLHAMLWACLRGDGIRTNDSTVPLWEHACLGLRDDWTIVSCKEESDSGMPGFLKNLLGLG